MKGNSPSVILLLAGLIIGFLAGWSNQIALLLIAIGGLLGIASLLKFPILSSDKDHGSHALILLFVIGLMAYFPVTLANLGTGTLTLPTGTVQDYTPSADTPIQTTSVSPVSATVNLYVKNVNGTVFNGAGTGTVFALPLGTVSDRNDLMKKVYDGNTGALAPYTMTHTTGTGLFALNGFNGKIGDQIMFAGYQDATPGAGENVSWTKTATISGITAGSTPEWMLSDSTWQWTRYPTMQFFDGSDIVRNQYTDNETAAIERSVTFAAAPHNVGEQWTDSYLWVESPESSISAIKKVKIVSDDGSASAEYGMPYEIASTEPMFRAKPALNVTTNKMYMVGKFPADLIQQGASNRAKYFITPVYDHPATAPATNLLFYITTNTNALTTAGGHIDTPSGRFNLSLNNGAAADVWDWGN